MLYYISANNQDGDNMSLFIQANDEHHALRLYKDYIYKVTEWGTPNTITIFTIPTSNGQTGILEWGVDVKIVYKA